MFDSDFNTSSRFYAKHRKEVTMLSDGHGMRAGNDKGNKGSLTAVVRIGAYIVLKSWRALCW